MALLGQIAAGAGTLGSALKIAGSLFQNQISITDSEETDTIYLNTTQTADMTLSVQITEHPVAKFGSAVDHVSRNSAPLVLSAILTNRNLDLRRDPVGLLTAHAAAFAPEIVGAVAAGVSVASKFFDLGEDENTKKIRTLHKWMLNAVPVKVLGLRLDPQKVTPNREKFLFLIREIHPVVSVDTGDAVGVQITLMNYLFIQNASESSQGSFAKTLLDGALKAINPFKW